MKNAFTVVFILAMICLSMAPTTSFRNDQIQIYQREHSTILSDTGYTDDQVALNLTTIVGTGGTDYENAMNLLAASTLAIRRGESTEALSLVMPDTSDQNIQTPLDEWLTFLGGSTEELILVGDVNEGAYQDTILSAGLVNRITESDFIDTASTIATQYFRNSGTVVISYAEPNPSIYSDIVTLYNEAGTLSAPTTTSTGYSTRSSNNWEVKTSRTRSGGGVVAWTTGSTSVLNYQLAQLGISYGGKYYGLDYPWYGNHKMAYPYFAGFGTQWFFNFIDMYPYDRTASFTLYVSTLDIQQYPFIIGAEELAQIDLRVTSHSSTTPIGLYVLDPNGRLILDANRFALIESEMESTTIEATLAYPGPGYYTAYVTTPSSTGATYDIEITKRVFGDEYLESQLASANGLSIASLADSPLIYSDGEDLRSSVIQALSLINPSRIIVVDPSHRFTSTVLNSLGAFADTVDHVVTLNGIQEFISAEKGLPSNTGNVTIYDPNAGYFAAAGLSSASRTGIAIPLCYQGSSMVSKAQVPEQFAWHADYSVPFIGGFHFYDYWTSTPDLSTLHPEYDLMYDVYLEFQAWLNKTTQITLPETLILIAPYSEPGATLPPAFDRVVIGECRVGRYPSRLAESTFCQLMQSVLRVPLLSTLTNPRAVDSHVAYSHGMDVYTNSLSSPNVYSSNTFAPLMDNAGVSYVREAGPSVPSSVANDTILWLLSSHGISGDTLYRDDGRIALMSMNCYRGYESGRNPDSPDGDGDALVNPPSSYLIDLYLSSFIAGNDLQGLIAYIDTCEIGSSYSPALLLEAGAETVVACWVDSFFGGSDLLEENTMHEFAESNMTLSDSLVSGFVINSHVYSSNLEGREVYNYNVIGATANQFVIFGNPEVKLYDYRMEPPRVVRRIESDTPAHFTTTLGYSVSCNVALRDHFGVPIENENIEYSVLDPNEELIEHGILSCPDNFSAHITVNFSEDLNPGNYTILFSSPFSSDSFRVSVSVLMPTPLQSMALESALGSSVNVTMGLKDHEGLMMPTERYECIVWDPTNEIYYSGSVDCPDGSCTSLVVGFDVGAVPGIYSLEYWRPGTSHTFTVLINVHDHEVIGPGLIEVSIGESTNITFGLSGYLGLPLEFDIFEYALYDPSDTVVAAGVVQTLDNSTSSVSLAFPYNSQVGVYEFDFNLPGSAAMHPILINVYDLVLCNDAVYVEVVTCEFGVSVGLEDFRGTPVTISVLHFALYSPSSTIVLEGNLNDISASDTFDIVLPISSAVGLYVLQLSIPGTSRTYDISVNLHAPTYTGPTYLGAVLGSTAAITFDFVDLVSASIAIDLVEYAIANPEGQIVEHGFIDREVSGFPIFSFDISPYDPVGNYTMTITPAGASFSYTTTLIVRAPELLINHVSVPDRPQVGVWQIDIDIQNLESISVIAQLTVLVNSITIEDELVELHPGTNLFILHMDMIDLSLFNPENTQITVLLNYGNLLSQDAMIPLTQSWQVTTIYSMIPLLGAALAVNLAYRRRLHGELSRLEMAQKQESAGGRGVATAFAVYKDYNMPKSALRAAIRNDLPEQMLHDLVSLGGNVPGILSKEASQFEQHDEYQKAARIFGALGRPQDQLRNEMFLHLNDDDMSRLTDLSNSILERRQTSDFILALIQLSDTEQFGRAIALLETTEQYLDQIVQTVRNRADILPLFEDLLLRMETGPLFYKYSIALALWDPLIERIIEGKTASQMVERTNEIESKHRMDIVTRVVSRLLEKQVFAKTAAYIRQCKLDGTELKQVIGVVGTSLFANPEDKAPLKVLTGLKSISNEAKQQVEELATVHKIISDQGKGASGDFSGLLKAASICSNAELAERLLDRAVEISLGEKSVGSLGIVELGNMTQTLREARYSASDQSRPPFDSRIQSLESSLIQKIIDDAKSSLKTINFNPELPATVDANIRELTEKLISIPCANSNANINALIQASELRSIQEITELTQKPLSSGAIMTFTMRISSDRMRLQRIANRAAKFVSTPQGLRRVVDETSFTRYVIEEAVMEWTTKAYEMWKTATFRAALQTAFNSVQRTIPKKQKIDLLAENLHRFCEVSRGLSGMPPDQIFTLLMANAGLTAEEQIKTIDASKLASSSKIRFKSLVKV